MTTISTTSVTPSPSFDLNYVAVGEGDQKRWTPTLSWTPSAELQNKVILQAKTVFTGIEKALKSDVIVDKEKIIQDMQLAITTGVALKHVESYKPFTTPELQKKFCFTFIEQSEVNKNDILKAFQDSCAVFRKDKLDAFLAKFDRTRCKLAFDQLSPSQKKIYELALIALSQLLSQDFALTTVLLSDRREECDVNFYKSKGLIDGTAQVVLANNISLLQFYAIKIATSFKVV